MKNAVDKDACTIKWMLSSKVMPYLLRLAAPLTDSSIVQDIRNEG